MCAPVRYVYLFSKGSGVCDHLGKLEVSGSGQAVSIIVRLIYILFALRRG